MIYAIISLFITILPVVAAATAVVISGASLFISAEIYLSDPCIQAIFQNIGAGMIASPIGAAIGSIVSELVYSLALGLGITLNLATGAFKTCSQTP